MLFGEKYVTKNLSDIKKKDSSQELRGIWAVEFGELASIATADIETLKEFLSRAVDKYRPTYGQIKISVPRNCVFWGTTNAESFLKDETGNRRFWVIVLTQAIDLEYVRAHRNEIWGEAYALAKAGEPHWFTRIKEQEAEERNHDFLSIDAWADPIYGYCLGKTFVRTDQIYQMAICGGDINAAKTLDERAQRRISRVLTILGAKSSTKRIDGRVLRVWQLPVTFCAELRIAENNKDVTVVTPNVNDSAEKDCPQNAFLQVLAKFRN